MPTDGRVYNATFRVDGYHDEKRYDKEDLIFEAGVTEALKRLLHKRDDYDLIKMVRVILDVEYEKDE